MDALETTSNILFEYPPLDRPTKSIRLLRFKNPPVSAGHYDFELMPHILSTAPPFTCLSYTWGDPHGPQQKIWINGLQFFVRENLFAALRMFCERIVERSLSKRNSEWFTREKLRRKPPLRLNPGDLDGWWDGNLDAEHFWIDAICINQHDILERGHQVGMMRNVFSGARLVIAWLGDSDTEQSFAAFHAVVHETLQDMPSASSEELGLQGINLLVALPYWKRMWIKQEFILPARLVIVWGIYGVWWRAFAKFFRLTELSDWQARNFGWAQANRRDEPEVLALAMAKRGLTDLAVLCLHKHRREGPTTSASSRTLDTLLRDFHRGECLDPRDKVYALLGLAGVNDDSQQLLPDYTISTTQLYYQTLCCIRHSPSLADEASWNSIRVTLSEALGIPNDRALELSEIVYKVSEPDRPLGQPPSHFFPDWRLALAEKTLATLRENLKHTDCFKLFGVEDPQNTYDFVVNRLNFPRQEDPIGWQCFDYMLREALELPLAGEEEIFESFIDYPEDHEPTP